MKRKGVPAAGQKSYCHSLGRLEGENMSKTYFQARLKSEPCCGEISQVLFFSGCYSALPTEEDF